MLRFVFSLFTLLLISGCASISHPLAKCDGYSKRPLNRSMWQWENTKPASFKSLGYAAESEPSSEHAFKPFDEPASHATCGEGLS